MFVLSAALFAVACFGQPFGTWKLNASRSTFAGSVRPRALTLRIEPHAKGEVITVDRTELNGRRISSSVILYLDGVARDFQQGECFGKQSSRRIDSQRIEILRNCIEGGWSRFVRRTAPRDDLTLEISERLADGRRFDRRLVFEKAIKEEK